ncbi:restriction endonuclease subunit S [Propionimicrobium lymphophilum]|uniref:restriction endonuclease subunit S n=1 Tax=Propionimicrobium lymphophilum TaxID=33012 RepID=UPI0003FF498C|nr:restriction endonuclease subunit S [Propionimicrobium lymphophilum]
MSRIDELIRELCPDGVEHSPMGEVGVFERGTGLQKKQLVNAGVPAIHYGQIYTQYSYAIKHTTSYVSETDSLKLKHASPGDVLIATTSENDEDLCKAVAWLGKEKLAFSGDCCSFSSSLNAQFVSYFFGSAQFHKAKQKFITGTKVRRVSPTALEKIEIPVPPLPVQDEIVRILDSFTQLEAELEARRKQYEYYRDSLLSFENLEARLGGGIRLMPLGEVGTVRMCKRVLKNQTEKSGDVPFFKIGTFGKKADAYISKELYHKLKNDFSFPKKCSILISASGTIGNTVIYDGKPAYFQDSNIVWLEHDESLVINKFLYYIYQAKPWIVPQGGTIKRLYNEIILNTKIPIPPLSEQERIVSVLDKFDALTTDLSSGLPAEIQARRKQYEYYRDRLLTFEEAK